MLFLMVPIKSPNSIDKWVIFLGKVDFSQYLPTFFNKFDSRFLLISPKWHFFGLEYYSSVFSSKWHQFDVSTPLQSVTINIFIWNPAIWNEYRGFLEKAHKMLI